jgi:hypothetical protein
MGQAFASFEMQLKQFPTNFPPTDSQSCFVWDDMRQVLKKER